MKRIIFYLLVISMTACAPAQPLSTQTSQPSSPQINQEVTISFEISSPAFANGEPIPSDFSCAGRDISPTLTWTEPPAGTQSFALIMDDPDAPSGSWVHWIIFNIPASTRNLAEGMPTDPKLSDGSLQGKISSGTSGYHGPCPPSGTHRYFFKLYALNTMLDLPTNARKEDLSSAMEGHILANAELMGTFTH
jgi:Raf kinase inhibitor-like YbhB/YbcL family protein